MHNQSSNKRIAINTAVIYVRLVLTLGISLFSTRYVLEALGEANFGLYNVIAGVVSLFSFIAATMATTTQRFISFTMGETTDLNRIKAVIGSSLTLHAIVSFVVAIIVLAGGYWAIENLLTIPVGMNKVALFVLFSVCIGLVGTVNSVPFEALLMAHENILFVSICQVINALVKFGGAILLLYIDVNRLKVYAIIMASLPFILYALEALFCLKHYPEVRITRRDLRPSVLMRELGKFAGWVMIGTTCMTLRTQGVSILLNIFWGVVVNAANGIATQVNSTLQFFSTSITTSLRPQLVKSAGEKDDRRMMTLIFAACKYPLLLITLAGCPLIVAMPYVLSLWLKEVPTYAAIFCQIMIIDTMIRQSYMGIVIGLEARGKVKPLHIFVGFSYLIVLPAGYILAKMGHNPQSILWCMVVSQALIATYLILLSSREIDLPMMKLIRDVYFRCSIVIIGLFLINGKCWNVLSHNIQGLLILCLVDIGSFVILSYYIGLTKHEQIKIVESVIKMIRR